MSLHGPTGTFFLSLHSRRWLDAGLCALAFVVTILPKLHSAVDYRADISAVVAALCGAKQLIAQGPVGNPLFCSEVNEYLDFSTEKLQGVIERVAATMICDPLTYPEFFEYLGNTNLNHSMLLPDGAIAVFEDSDVTSVNWSTVTQLCLVGNYAPLGFDFAACVNLEVLRLFDGTLEGPLRTAIQNVAKTQKKLRVLETKTWGTSALEASAFAGATALQQLIGFTDITSIGASCFDGCGITSSESLPFASNLTILPDYAFRNCTALTSANFANVGSLGVSVFEGCNSLVAVTLQPTLSYLPDKTFKGCTSITSVSFENTGSQVISGSLIFPNVTSFGTNVFEGCSLLSSVILSSAITSLPNYTFCDCVALGSRFDCPNITSLGPFVFQRCTALTYVNFPSLPILNQGVFYGCTSLVSEDIAPLFFPMVTGIGPGAFFGCTKMGHPGLFPKCIAVSHGAFEGTSIGRMYSFLAENIDSWSFPLVSRLERDSFLNTPLRSIALGECTSLPDGILDTNSTNLYELHGPRLKKIPNASKFCPTIGCLTIPANIQKIDYPRLATKLLMLVIASPNYERANHNELPSQIESCLNLLKGAGVIRSQSLSFETKWFFPRGGRGGWPDNPKSEMTEFTMSIIRSMTTYTVTPISAGSTTSIMEIPYMDRFLDVSHSFPKDMTTAEIISLIDNLPLPALSSFTDNPPLFSRIVYKVFDSETPNEFSEHFTEYVRVRP
ncbi:MAG: leucine-rich repeat domain-containing protein [Holosporales bacterium]|jgi:hypothetical protein|nr:leucine-rich repeat domain-containing protein [Holosporales bacterium]